MDLNIYSTFDTLILKCPIYHAFTQQVLLRAVSLIQLIHKQTLHPPQVQV